MTPMITEVYIPTRGINHLILTVVSYTNVPVNATCNNSTITIPNPLCNINGKSFYKFKWNNLSPGQEYRIVITQDKTNNQIKLKTSTLPKPSGERLYRFGILSDAHINNYSNKSRLFNYETKRLYSKANELCEKYIKVIEKLGADFIVFPGDTLDSGTYDNLKIAQTILSKANIPCYVIIGNHEPYGNISLNAFYSAFKIPQNGYYAFIKENTRLLFLNTPTQSSLDRGTEQLKWLKNELREFGNSHNIFLFSHFSLILHPCVEGWKNDGLQQIDNYKEVLELLDKYPGVRAFIAGHKNVPSRIMVNRIAHMLTPQLFQAPCSFDFIDVYENGFTKSIHEIDELDYLQVSRNAFGNGWPERYGNEESRNFTLHYD